MERHVFPIKTRKILPILKHNEVHCPPQFGKLIAKNYDLPFSASSTQAGNTLNDCLVLTINAIHL